MRNYSGINPVVLYIMFSWLAHRHFFASSISLREYIYETVILYGSDWELPRCVFKVSHLGFIP